MEQILAATSHPSIMSRIAGLVATASMAGLLLSWGFPDPTPVDAIVEISRGTVAEMDQKVMRELVAAFDRAEVAVQQADLEAVMLFYARGYNYHGLKRPDVRRVWDEVFSHYRAINSKHVFTDLRLEKTGNGQKAFVTCTGELYGIEKDTGKQITIDNWVNEVHFLVKEDGEWKFLGNAGGPSPAAPPASAPHHPLF
jgi:hypothetical protein